MWAPLGVWLLIEVRPAGSGRPTRLCKNMNQNSGVSCSELGVGGWGACSPWNRVVGRVCPRLLGEGMVAF